MPDPDPGPILAPCVDWRWFSTDGTAQPIRNRPWWGNPDFEVSEPDGGAFGQQALLQQKYWYPDPALGWDCFAYQLGGSSLGYVLFYNRFCGLGRLFVYRPPELALEHEGFNFLAVNLSLRDTTDQPLDTWSFAVADSPPGASQLGDQVVGDIGRASSAVWALLGQDDSGLGTWWRAEIPFLFDPRLYDTPGGPERHLLLEFYGITKAHVDLAVTLTVQLNGVAVPSTPLIQGGERNTLGIGKDTVLGGITAGAGASTILQFITEDAAAGTGWGIAAIAAVSLAGAYLGFSAENEPLHAPGYNVALVGVARGEATGGLVEVSELTQHKVYLSGTFDPGSNNDPNAWRFQRRLDLRLGEIGFSARVGQSLDPRPQGFWTVIYPDGTRYLAIAPDDYPGYLQLAPWVDATIVYQAARYETIWLNPRFSWPDNPSSNGVRVGWTLDDPATGNYDNNYDSESGLIIIGSLDGPITWPSSAVAQQFQEDQRAGRPWQGKSVMRWFAKVEPAAGRAFDLHYALDVSDATMLGTYDERPEPPPPPDDPPPADTPWGR